MDQSTLYALPPLEGSDACGIQDRVQLERVGGMSISPVETSSAVVVGLALWERQGLQEAAERHLGA